MTKETNNLNHSEKKNENSLWNNSLVIFFFAPIVFLFVAKFTGSQIFYGNKNTTKKQVLLLSAGSLFYLIAFIIALI